MNLTNYQLQKAASEAVQKYMGLKVMVKQITLLEANMDGSYIMFAIGNSKPCYELCRSLWTTFWIYPTWEGKNGCIIYTDRDERLVNEA